MNIKSIRCGISYLWHRLTGESAAEVVATPVVDSTAANTEETIYDAVVTDATETAQVTVETTEDIIREIRIRMGKLDSADEIVESVNLMLRYLGRRGANALDEACH